MKYLTECQNTLLEEQDLGEEFFKLGWIPSRLLRLCRVSQL